MGEASAGTDAFLSNGAALFVFVVAAALTVPTALTLLWQYRRVVQTAMRRRSGEVMDPLPAASVERATADRALTLEMLEPGARLALPPGAQAVLRRALRGPWLTALVYGVAGAGQALVIAYLLLLGYGIEVLPGRMLVLTWVHAWPILLTVNLVTSASLRAQAISAAVYFGGLAILLLAIQPEWLSLAAVTWVMHVALPTVLLLALLHRKARAIGPLVFVSMVLGVGGAQLTLAALATDAGQRAVVELAVATEVGVVAAFYGLLLGAFALFVAGSWWALRWIRGQYAAKQASDQSITTDAVWLIFALNAVLMLSTSGMWAATPLLGFVIFKLLGGLGFWILRRALGEPENQRLLLLRVFGSPERSEHLMQAVGARWRYAGSIQLIAGTDLATTTIEPHEFLDFIRGQLAAQFIQTRDDLEQRLESLDTRPDFDRRFRINEFLCYDDTWRTTLVELVKNSRVVLMDLRGFTPANQGVVYELRQLLDSVPLDRTVLLADGTTDMAYLRQVLDESWASLAADSPNWYALDARLTICRLDNQDSAAIRLVLATMARAATVGADTPLVASKASPALA